MTWNYRLTVLDGVVGIREAYYKEDGSIDSVTQNTIGPMGESISEFANDMVHFIDAINKPAVKIIVEENKWRFEEMNSEELQEIMGEVDNELLEVWGKDNTSEEVEDLCHCPSEKSGCNGCSKLHKVPTPYDKN